jgi:hypothetical protein
LVRGIELLLDGVERVCKGEEGIQMLVEVTFRTSSLEELRDYLAAAKEYGLTDVEVMSWGILEGGTDVE